MTQNKDCLTCKWEPEWEEGLMFTIGKCKKLPTFLSNIKIYKDDLKCFVKHKISFQAGHGSCSKIVKNEIKDCNLWETK